MYKGTVEDVIRKMYQTEKKLDAVNPVAVKKKFDDRKDKDIDNDGDVDSSDKFLHKKRKAISKAVKGEAETKGKKDSIEVNPKIDDMREKVQIPDKMKAKMDKIVKALNKSVGAHAKQAKTISKMTSMDKVDEISKDTLRSYSTKASDASKNKNIPVHKQDNRVAGVKKASQRLGERKLTDKEMKKREDVAQAIKRDDPDMPMDKKMAIATSVAKKTKGEDVEEKYTPAQIKMAHGIANHPRYKAGDHTGAMKAIEKIKKGLSLHPTVQKHLKKANEDIIRRGDVKVVKVKGPDGKPMFKKMKPVVKVDDPADHAMKAEETITEAEMNYKVSIEGLPDFFVNAKNPGEVKIKMRKMLKKPDMLTQVQRVPDAAMKKHFRLKAQGKDEDEQQPMKEETVMSEDNTNPLVKAVSDILSRNSFNSFRDVKPIQEKEMVDKSPGQQDAGAKSMQKSNVASKAKDQDKKIPQGASMLHMCAKNVMHEKFGRGECLFGMHGDPDENGHVSHYDIMFNHGIEKNMPITECEVLHERSHGMKGHKKDKKEDK